MWHSPVWETARHAPSARPIAHPARLSASVAISVWPPVQTEPHPSIRYAQPVRCLVWRVLVRQPVAHHVTHLAVQPTTCRSIDVSRHVQLVPMPITPIVSAASVRASAPTAHRWLSVSHVHLGPAFRALLVFQPASVDSYPSTRYV